VLGSEKSPGTTITDAADPFLLLGHSLHLPSRGRPSIPSWNLLPDPKDTRMNGAARCQSRGEGRGGMLEFLFTILRYYNKAPLGPIATTPLHAALLCRTHHGSRSSRATSARTAPTRGRTGASGSPSNARYCRKDISARSRSPSRNAIERLALWLLGRYRGR